MSLLLLLRSVFTISRANLLVIDRLTAPLRWTVGFFKSVPLRRVAAYPVTMSAAYVSSALLLRTGIDSRHSLCISLFPDVIVFVSNPGVSLLLQTASNILLNHLIPRTLINPTLLLPITAPLLLRPY